MSERERQRESTVEGLGEREREHRESGSERKE